MAEGGGLWFATDSPVLVNGKRSVQVYLTRCAGLRLMAPRSLCLETDMRWEKSAMIQRHCGLVLDDTTRLKPAGGRSTLTPKFVRSHVAEFGAM